MAIGITVGKIAISVLAAFAITYFRFPFRMTAFWLIFMSLMLPIEVRIVPTYESAANVALPLNMPRLDWLGIQVAGRSRLESGQHLFGPDPAADRLRHGDLPLPPVLPHHSGRALRGGAHRRRRARGSSSGMILLPLSRSNIVALAIILFLTGWNQYLWPLLFTTEHGHGHAVIGLKKLMPQSRLAAGLASADERGLLTMLPPTVVILLLQRWFVKGLVDSGK